MRAKFLIAAACVGGMTSCAQFVGYTDELVNVKTGRSVVVTTPAWTGRFIGFVGGIPVSIAALPVTFTVYQVQKSNDPIQARAMETFAAPSDALARVCSLIAVPFDAFEWLIHRAWQPDTTLTHERREAFEQEIDAKTLPRYPVETVYPKPEKDKKG